HGGNRQGTLGEARRTTRPPLPGAAIPRCVFCPLRTVPPRRVQSRAWRSASPGHGPLSRSARFSLRLQTDHTSLTGAARVYPRATASRGSRSASREVTFRSRRGPRGMQRSGLCTFRRETSAGERAMSPAALARIRPEIVYAWRGPAALIVDNSGRAGTDTLTGFYFRQTRFLNTLQLTLGQVEPYRCSLAQAAPNALEVTYIHPEVERGGGGGSGSGGLGRKGDLLYRDLDLRLRYRVRPASL